MGLSSEKRERDREFIIALYLDVCKVLIGSQQHVMITVTSTYPLMSLLTRGTASLPTEERHLSDMDCQ